MFDLMAEREFIKKITQVIVCQDDLRTRNFA